MIVVEHDEEMMRAADWIVDIGPGAGVHGGEVVAAEQHCGSCSCVAITDGVSISAARVRFTRLR
ncbi:MAG: hypothetical protein R2848_08110 [Thermomicrobiales bacterium]